MAGSKNRFTTYVDFKPEELLINLDDDETNETVSHATSGNSSSGETMSRSSVDMGSNPSKEPNSVPESSDSVSDTGTDTTGTSVSTDNRSSYVSCDSEVDQQSDDKLCGYLNKYKIGARALGKNFKRRWFVFADNTCKLLYFRTPQDIIPLGEIDIAGASFSFDTGLTAGRSNVFQISSTGKTYCLEAPDNQTMLYWLQELQRKRRHYSKKKTVLSSRVPLPTTVQQPAGGLISIDRKFSSSSEQDSATPLVASLEMPNQTVGQNTATDVGCGLSDLSFANWKTELRNALASFRHKRQSDIDPVVLSPAASPNHERSPLSPRDKVCSMPLLEEKSGFGSRLSSFKRRITVRPRSEAPIMEISLPQQNSIPAGDSCVRCQQLQAMLQSQRDDLNTVEEELHAHREMSKILERQIGTLQRQRLTQQTCQVNTDEQQYLNELHARDKQLVELEHLLAATQEEKEIIRYQLRSFEAEVNHLEEQISVFRESLKAKDEAVIILSNRVLELEQAAGIHNPTQLAPINTTLSGLVDTKEIDKLRDLVKGYEAQNKFLSKEIVELNRLRVDDESREKQLYMRGTELEARYYQIQSKYLLCVEQLRIPLKGGGHGEAEEMVSMLLQDAMDTEIKHKVDELHPSRPSPMKYDKYGFSMMPRDVEDDLIAKATNFQRKSEELKVKDIDKEISWNVKWENYLVSLGNRGLQRCPELKTLIRGGIPPQHREKVWNTCVQFYVAKHQERLGHQYYHSLLDKLKHIKLNPASKQIELDLLRTLPHNKHYETMNSEGIPKLRRVLLAYTQHNPLIGYCQGLNRLVAIALLFMNEEEAFWALVAIVEFIMPPDYYTSTLIAAQVDQRVLKDLVQEKIPRLWSHFEQYEVDLSLFSFNWFLTVFVDNIPPETYLRIWDCFLYESNKVLFRFAIAFLKYREEHMLMYHDTMTIHHFLRCMTEDMSDIERISQIAFQDINRFPMRRINYLRQMHMEQVKTELAELDALRKDYQPPCSRESRLLECVSDDDI